MPPGAGLYRQRANAFQDEDYKLGSVTASACSMSAARSGQFVRCFQLVAVDRDADRDEVSRPASARPAPDRARCR